MSITTYELKQGLENNYGVSLSFTNNYSSSAPQNMYVLPNIKTLNYSTVINIDPDWIIDPTWHGREYKIINKIYNSTINYTYGIFTYGHSNFIFALITMNGEILINEYLFNNIFNSALDRPEIMDDFVGKLHHIFNYVKKIKSSYFSLDDLSLQREDLIIGILSRIKSSNVVNLSESDLLTIIKKTISDASSRNNPMSLVDLYNQNNVARNTLVSMYNRCEKETRKSFNRGFNMGTLIYSAFIKCGYSLDSYGLLAKEVNIQPEFCIRHDQRYRIPEGMQKSKITKLTFDMAAAHSYDLVLLCKGTHPNVSGSGRVCIGNDNNLKFKELMSANNSKCDDLVDLLNLIENSLLVINYDSSYYQERVEYMQQLIKITDIIIKNPNSNNNIRKI